MITVLGALHSREGIESLQDRSTGFSSEIDRLYFESSGEVSGACDLRLEEPTLNPFMQAAVDAFPAAQHFRIDGTFADTAGVGMLLKERNDVAVRATTNAAVRLLHGRHVLRHGLFGFTQEALVDNVNVFAAHNNLREKRMAQQIEAAEIHRTDPGDSVVIVGASHAEAVSQRLSDLHGLEAKCDLAVPDWFKVITILGERTKNNLLSNPETGVEAFLSVFALNRAIYAIRAQDRAMKTATPLPTDLDILATQDASYGQELYSKLAHFGRRFGRQKPYEKIVEMAVDLAR